MSFIMRKRDKRNEEIRIEVIHINFFFFFFLKLSNFTNIAKKKNKDIDQQQSKGCKSQFLVKIILKRSKNKIEKMVLKN